MTFPFFSAMVGIVFMAGMVSLVLSIAGVIPRDEMPTLIMFAGKSRYLTGV